MTFRPHRRYLLVSLALTLAPSGCGALLGLDDFKEGATTGAGGVGGTGGAASSSSVSSSNGGSCVDGTTMACYTGPENTVDKGKCMSGIATCQSGMYGACAGETLPQPEACNT